ncbi:P2X purinoceptor 7 [Ixodes scapularis]|uniref:P2X purinoceptor 7 n=1 Tax=Ixodes scapularis TaxID=6945 RepID=UPI001A9FFAD9|nr:P2X purinoceptor 7 [Ixodes scapularis]
MAAWVDGLSDVERKMLAYSKSVGLVPYASTPPKRHREQQFSSEDSAAPPDPSPDPDGWRLSSTAWCSCKRCSVMPTSRECLCCRECPPAVATQPEGCVTEHMDFALICLQPAVLRIAYWALDEAGLQPAPGEQTLRFVAYKQFTRWMWKRLGRNNRRVLPACVVSRIREEFASDSYTGYLDAE